MSDLFASLVPERHAPLAARMRPRRLEEYLGQEHVLGEGKPLRLALERGQMHSMLFWGPPGVGKTTLAKLMAEHIDAQFIALSAVLAGVKDIRQALEEARAARLQHGRATIVFVDEVHRFNKAQQDAFLPGVEEGDIYFVGATTENPSFEVNNALLSRCRVYVLNSFDEGQLQNLLRRALQDEARGLGGRGLHLGEEALALLVQAADGDARRALNLLEIASDLAEPDGEIRLEALRQVAAGGTRRFDNKGEAFYDQISALHKSLRGSDPDAGLYWMMRMLDGGCDPLYIARRLVRFASEDIGNADPRALDLALNAWDTLERLGSPEGELTLAHAVIYLACAPKSNAVYRAFKAVRADVQASPSHEVPLHLRNAPTKLMAELDYGKGYRYAHDEPEGFAAGERYFPDDKAAVQYYQPSNRGLEQKISEKLAYLRQRNDEARQRNDETEASRR